ncbi:MAG: CvpA family protein [Clostridiales bacterium]|nr:CvpA family protein [Clostridiales bacterium]
MSFIFDIALIAIIAFTIFKGARRGFIKSVMSFVSLIVAIIVANTYSPSLSAWYYDKFIISSVSEKIRQFVSGFIPVGKETVDMSAVFGDQTFTEMIERYGGDLEQLKASYGSFTEATAAKIDELAVTVADPVARTISNVLGYASIFFGALIILWIVSAVVDLIFKLPVLRTANKLLGVLFGIVCALLYAWLFSIIAVFGINALSAIEPDIFGSAILDNSVLLKFFNENNLLRSIFFK